MLVGRESEIATIDRVLDEARSGRTSGLIVAGEAGVGKTALLDDTVARAAEFLVLRTRGVEAEAEVPFAALIELLGPVASRIDALPRPQARALQAVFALAGLQQLEATATRLSRAPAKRPDRAVRSRSARCPRARSAAPPLL